MGPWELPLQPSSPALLPVSPGLSFSNSSFLPVLPLSFSFLESPSISFSLSSSNLSNVDHFPGCLLPSSPSAEGRSLPPPLSLSFLRFLLFPSYNMEEMSLFLSIFLAAPAAPEPRSLSYSAGACLGPFISCPLALSHFTVPPSPVSPPLPPFFQFLGAPYSSTISPALKSFPASFR